MNEQFLELVRDANRILVTSHISPDPDAACSTLLVGRALAANYPDKKVVMSLEEELEQLSFLAGIKDIAIADLTQVVEEEKPDLLIIVDANSYKRITRNDPDKLKRLVHSVSTPIKTVIIDHHEAAGRDEAELFVCEISPATAQIVYSLLFEKLSLKKPEGYADAALLGIISDSSRFLHDNPGHRDTFRIVNDLLDAGASIEVLTNRISRYSLASIKAFGELANNVVAEGGYTYSFISEEFKESWLKAGYDFSDLKSGAEIFVSNYLRSIEDKLWGFIVYPELAGEAGVYGVSLRSVSGARDVSIIAHRLGGGGHKPAAGAKVQASNAQEAIEKVKQAIAAIVS